MNFQLLEAWDVDMENFNYNVSDMVDNIFVGPQGELLESVNNFNNTHNSNIGITKSFTLKPGGYDQIKAAHSRWVMRYDMKPRGIKSIFDRIEQYKWRAGAFKSNLLSIESKMKELKQAGLRWQDNSDQLIEELNKLKSSITSSLEVLKEMFPHIDVSCKVIPANKHNPNGRYYGSYRFPYHTMFAQTPNDFMIVFYIKIKNLSMNVHVMDQGTTDQYVLPMDDIYIATGTYLLPLISRHWGRSEPRTDNPPSLIKHFMESI